VGDQLRIAVAGTGFIGRVHAHAARVAGAHLVAVAASTPASAERAAAELGAERAAASAEQLATADDVDVLHVCTPNDSHEPLAVAALEAGKHVVLEKPVALDAAGATRIAAVAAAAGRVVAVPYVYRYHPTARQARALVADGSLGTLRLLHGSYQQDWLMSEGDTSWRVDRAVGGPSRAFADIGSHWCDLVELTSGQRIVRVLARLSTAVDERPSVGGPAFSAPEDFGDDDLGDEDLGDEDFGDGAERRPVDTEDVALVLFETDRGVPGSLVVSQVSPGRKNRLWFELDGSVASVVFDQERADVLEVGRREGTTTLFRDPTTFDPAAARLATLPAGHAQGYQDCFDLFVADAYAAMAGHEPDGLPTVADGVRTAHLIDAVLASAAGRTWQEVAS
jgi:predicted dehydrogenase